MSCTTVLQVPDLNEGFWLARIENNTVLATAFKAIKAPRKHGEREENETEKGLRIADKGFLNTAVITSEITYIDGDAGGKSVVLEYSYALSKSHSVLRYRSVVLNV